MTGLGRKIFTRERLTVADTQGYLMDQSVMVFASASARGTTIASPSEGMVTYLADRDRYEGFDGTAWRLMSMLNPPLPFTVPTNATPVRTTELDSFANYVLADPMQGQSYRLRTQAIIRCATTDCATATRIRVGSSSLTPGTEPILSEVSSIYTPNGFDCVHPPRLSGVITGAARIVGHAVRFTGTGSWQISPAPSLIVEIVPV